MKAQIEIKMDNAAFTDAPATELAEILRKLASDIEEGSTSKKLLDCHGNHVGFFQIKAH